MKDKNILNYVGVFAIALLVAASAVYIYSPVIGSHAGEMTAKVSAVVNPVASLTLDTDNLEFNVSPTIEGSFNSGSITASVNTNSLGGYELYFSSEDNETNMVHDNGSVTDVIASDFEGTVTSETMGANKWGYSLDNVDFLKIPALSNQATLRDIDHMPDSSEKNNTVYIGTKISTGLSSGSYSKKVVFSVLAHETPEPPVPMQGYDGSKLEVGKTVKLVDERDGNIYTAKKLDDGNIWMTQNLRIVGKTISGEDSNIPDGESFTIPESDISSFHGYDTVDDPNTAYYDSDYGGYYTFYTATAGWGETGREAGKSSKDICPKGWRLPYYKDIIYLTTVYNTLNSLVDKANMSYGGRIIDSLTNKGNQARYWTAELYSTNMANYLSLVEGRDSANYGNTWNALGFSLRCMLKDSRDINDVTYMQELNPNINNNTAIGATANLVDLRDGNTYAVKKMGDGNLWMIENLRISDKTISHKDSNLPIGKTYTVPKSDLSSFTSEADTDAVYIDSKNGGYYRYHTAVAGFKATYSQNDISPYDICPKGWELPDARNGYHEYYNLSENHKDWIEEELDFKATGYVDNGSMIENDSVGLYWSSESGTYYARGPAAVALKIVPSQERRVYDDAVELHLGAQIRCIARNTSEY